MKFLNIRKDQTDNKEKITELVESFLDEFDVLEKKSVNVLTDNKTGAFYVECNIKASVILDKGTIDVPLDPEEQQDYRANREPVENNPAYMQMIEDANQRRVFSNIIAEYNVEFDPNSPLKIIGGQHRFLAINEAMKSGVDEYHGFKVYFGLDTQQRLDVQLISNTNISVSNDLLDRMFETVKGPELRLWCQKVGILDSDQDFADKKQRGSQISVRGARTLIMNYLEGKKIPDKEFNDKRTTPILPGTGSVDDDWETVRAIPGIWKDKKMISMGEAYAKIMNAQRQYYKEKSENNEFADKALSYSTLAAWAYVAGVLHNNAQRLKRHYGLSDNTKTDPLNAVILAKGRHKTDPENYRGLGTRTDVKDRGRLTELFFIQAEKGEGINKKIVELAVQKYHAKDAVLKVKQMEGKL